MRLTEPDRVQSRCYSLLETWHSCTHERFISAQLAAFALVNLWGHVRIEIPHPALFPLRIPHPNPIKTRNPAPARNCNFRFPPLFSAQIPNITAIKAKSRIPSNLLGTLLSVRVRRGSRITSGDRFRIETTNDIKMSATTTLKRMTRLEVFITLNMDRGLNTLRCRKSVCEVLLLYEGELIAEVNYRPFLWFPVGSHVYLSLS